MDEHANNLEGILMIVVMGGQWLSFGRTYFSDQFSSPFFFELNRHTHHIKSWTTSLKFILLGPAYSRTALKN
jgi:hypothetical protein